MEITLNPNLQGKRFVYLSGDQEHIIDHIIIKMIPSHSIDSGMFFVHYIIDKNEDIYPLNECIILMDDELSDLYSKAVLRQNKSI